MSTLVLLLWRKSPPVPNKINQLLKNMPILCTVWINRLIIYSHSEAWGWKHCQHQTSTIEILSQKLWYFCARLWLTHALAVSKVLSIRSELRNRLLSMFWICKLQPISASLHICSKKKSSFLAEHYLRSVSCFLLKARFSFSFSIQLWAYYCAALAT